MSRRQLDDFVLTCFAFGVPFAAVFEALTWLDVPDPPSGFAAAICGFVALGATRARLDADASRRRSDSS